MGERTERAAAKSVLTHRPGGGGGDAARRRLRLPRGRFLLLLTFVVVAGLVLAACERRSTHEPPNNTLDYPTYDEKLPNSGNATYGISQDRGYEGSQYSAKAHYTGSTNPPQSRAYGGFNVNVQDKYHGRSAAAFYFPSQTFTGGTPKQEGAIDIMRWDGPESNFGAIRIGSDHKARLIRGKPGTTESIGDPFTLQEGCWNWLVVEQRLSEESSTSTDHAINNVYLNGLKIIESRAPNKYSVSGGADTVRYGLPFIDTGTGANQQNDQSLDFYVDDAYISNVEHPAPGQTCAPSRPNILFIVTDDHRAEDTMQAMPNTTKWFRSGAVENGDVIAGGTEYAEGYATTPLCCPARASILTGRYAHSHGVRNNDEGFAIGGDLEETQLQSVLKTSGYRTGIAGKYLNDWNPYGVPPAFDKYWISSGGYLGGTSPNAQHGAYFNNNGTIECKLPGDTGCTYSTKYIGAKALEFINEGENNDAQPWFFYMAPFAPHAASAYPNESMVEPGAPQYDPPPPAANPSRNEGKLTDPAANASTDPIFDKPIWVQDWDQGGTLLAGARTATGGPLRDQQLRSLKSLDGTIEAVFDRLRETGEDQNTIAVFIGDNGQQWREHGLAQKESAETTTTPACPNVPPSTPNPAESGCGLNAKARPYTDSIKVPFFMRWPASVGVLRGVVDQNRYVGNIDLAPTAMQAAGMSPLPIMDGRSILDSNQTRSEILTENWTGPAGTWASLRGKTQNPTRHFHYIEYYKLDGHTPRTEEYPRSSDPNNPGPQVVLREYYDLQADPYELNNLFRDNDPLVAPNLPDQSFLDSLSDRLRRARVCSGTNCPPQTNSSTADTLAPRVWITEPTAGSTNGAAGLKYALGVRVSDNLGVSSVEFYEDGVLKLTRTTAPFTYAAGPFTQGTHELKAIARDYAGNVGQDQITVKSEDFDVQATNVNGFGNWNTTPGLGTMQTGDYITYKFDRPISPGTILPDWNGGNQSVTLRLAPDDPAQRYHDTMTVVGVPSLGTVDLGNMLFWGWRTSTVSYGDITGSTMTLAPDQRSVKITLGTPPSIGVPRSPEHNVMVWEPSTSICGPPTCRITESLEGRGASDGDF